MVSSVYHLWYFFIKAVNTANLFQFSPSEKRAGQIASPILVEREIFPRNFYLQHRNDTYMYRKVFLSSINWFWFYGSINNTSEMMKAFVKEFLPLRPVSCSNTYVSNLKSSETPKLWKQMIKYSIWLFSGIFNTL